MRVVFIRPALFNQFYHVLNSSNVADTLISAQRLASGIAAGTYSCLEKVHQVFLDEC